jgi:hypothetical protein
MSDHKPNPINRELQHKLLLMLRDEYPSQLLEIPNIAGATWIDICANLWYLQAHGLCDSGLSQHLGGNFSWSGANISAAGLDFLEDDGGLSAVLGVVTVKLHVDTLRALLTAKIDGAPITPEKKSALRSVLKRLSGTALTTATTELVTIGIQHFPDILDWLETLADL